MAENAVLTLTVDGSEVAWSKLHFETPRLVYAMDDDGTSGAVQRFLGPAGYAINFRVPSGTGAAAGWFDGRLHSVALTALGESHQLAVDIKLHKTGDSDGTEYVFGGLTESAVVPKWEALVA